MVSFIKGVFLYVCIGVGIGMHRYRYRYRYRYATYIQTHIRHTYDIHTHIHADTHTLYIAATYQLKSWRSCPPPRGCRSLSPRSGTSRGGGSFGDGSEIGDGGGGRESGSGCAMDQPPPMQCHSSRSEGWALSHPPLIVLFKFIGFPSPGAYLIGLVLIFYCICCINITKLYTPPPHPTACLYVCVYCVYVCLLHVCMHVYSMSILYVFIILYV